MTLLRLVDSSFGDHPHCAYGGVTTANFPQRPVGAQIGLFESCRGAQASPKYKYSETVNMFDSKYSNPVQQGQYKQCNPCIYR